MIKLDALLVFIGIGVQIYALIDVARTPQESFTQWHKWVWLIIVILFGLIGSLFWVVWGRRRNGNGGNGPRRPRPGKDLPPDDNPDFLRNL
jgi:heme/copper-type cytochrome/quinol oxidase subunit 2